MEYHSTPPPLSPTVHELLLVVCRTSEVGVLDAPRDVLWGSGQEIEQATPELECRCQKTTELHAVMCV